MTDSAAVRHCASCLSLPAMAASVATSRMYARDLMEKWHLPAVLDDVELVVSELVTNAVKAAAWIPPQARYPELHDRMEIVRTCFYRLPSELLVEVWDPRHEPPEPQTAEPHSEGGRGLFLVEALSSRWGTRWPRGGGKVVWAAFDLRGVTVSGQPIRRPE